MVFLPRMWLDGIPSVTWWKIGRYCSTQAVWVANKWKLFVHWCPLAASACSVLSSEVKVVFLQFNTGPVVGWRLRYFHEIIAGKNSSVSCRWGKARAGSRIISGSYSRGFGVNHVCVRSKASAVTASISDAFTRIQALKMPEPREINWDCLIQCPSNKYVKNSWNCAGWGWWQIKYFLYCGCQRFPMILVSSRSICRFCETLLRYLHEPVHEPIAWSMGNISDPFRWFGSLRKPAEPFWIPYVRLAKLPDTNIARISYSVKDEVRVNSLFCCHWKVPSRIYDVNLLAFAA